MYLWKHEQISLNFKTNWVISGGSASKKTNDFITISKDGLEGVGEISASTKNNDLNLITSDLKKINFESLQNLDAIYQLPMCPQVKAAIEMAWLHLQCQLENRTIFEVLNIPANYNSPTSFSIPILNEKETKGYISDFNIQRFPSCKLKIEGLKSLPSVLALAKNYDGPIRIDANESFASAKDVLEFIISCQGLNIEFIEQPLDRLNISESKILKKQTTIPIVGDESIQNEDVTTEHFQYFHGLNIKLMKSGGYKQAIRQLDQCRALGLKTMVGCMVETSLNILAALNISANCDWLDLDGHLLLENDPFILLDENNGIISNKQN